MAITGARSELQNLFTSWDVSVMPPSNKVQSEYRWRTRVFCPLFHCGDSCYSSDSSPRRVQMSDQQNKTCCPNSYSLPLPRKKQPGSWKHPAASTHSRNPNAEFCSIWTGSTKVHVQFQACELMRPLHGTLLSETVQRYLEHIEEFPNHLINMPQLWHRDTNMRKLVKLQMYASFSCFAYNFHIT